jgi:chromosome segregation ATPase
MDYFFSRVGRGFRYAATVAGSICLIGVIALGGLGINTIFIPIGGGIALIPMAMVMFENVKVIRDMEDQVSIFKTENKELKHTNENLKQTTLELDDTVKNLQSETDGIKQVKDKLVDENTKLEHLLDNAETNLDEMKTLANQYKNTSKELGENLKQTEKNRDELRQQAEELVKIKDSYMEQNEQLKANYMQAEQQLKEITTVKDNYEIQLQELSDNNKELSKTTEAIKVELNKVESQYEQSKSALKVLLQSTGVMKDLGEEMVKTEQKTSENVGMMSRLLNVFGINRSEDLFYKLDKDGDEMLSIDEFVKMILDEKTDDNSNYTAENN